MDDSSTLPGELGGRSLDRLWRASVWRFVAILLSLCGMTGCGGPPGIPGGTSGIVHVRNTPLRDVHVAIWRENGGVPEPCAFGISDPEGRFQLRVPGTLEAVWLEPGDYLGTVESSGEVPMVWPSEYQDPKRTPLRITWEEGEESLELEVPEPRVGR